MGFLSFTLALSGAAAYGQNTVQPLCQNHREGSLECSLYQEISESLKRSIIPATTAQAIWTEKKLAKALEGRSVFSAANHLLAQFGTSHTGIFSSNSTEYYDLVAITQYANGQPDAAVKALFGPTNPTYPGIGAWYRTRDNNRGYVITQIFPGSPAATAGLHVGDAIIEADGAKFGPVSSFSGKIGKSVELKIQRKEKIFSAIVRPAAIEPLAFYKRATRDTVRVFEISGRKIGYVRLYAFYQESDYEALKDLLTNGALANVQGVVLDLRGGWGGTPIHFANPFVGGLPEQEIEGYNGYKRSYNWNFCKPLSLIIDETTRSGKEIFAKTLHLNHIPLVGQRTSGDVLSTRISLIASGRAILELPLADVRVAGARLEKIGVEPDFYVDGAVDDQVMITGAAALMDFSNNTKRRPVCDSWQS